MTFFKLKRRKAGKYCCTKAVSHSFYRKNKSKSEFNIHSVEWNKPTKGNKIVNFNLFLIIFIWNLITCSNSVIETHTSRQILSFDNAVDLRLWKFWLQNSNLISDSDKFPFHLENPLNTVRRSTAISIEIHLRFNENKRSLKSPVKWQNCMPSTNTAK